jgi:DNA helicase-2/ATP-dependent DNA helicase PcrA
MKTSHTGFLDGLNDRQREAVEYLSGPLLIVAGAGAGKTKTITHRIAHLIASGVPASQILALSFTNKAAGEMRERAGKLLGLQLSGNYNAPHAPYMTTFHSLGVRMLREFGEKAGISPAFTIWDRDDSVRTIKRVLDSGLEGRFPPRQVMSRISREKGAGVTANQFAERAGSFYDEMVANTWSAYETAKAKEGALDFDDLLLKAHGLLAKDPSTLDALRERWPYLTIDEYQDTNAVQLEIARLLAGDDMHICAVGDVDQVLYSWRGADVKNLLLFEKTFPKTKVVLLEQNYRSTQTILTVANAIIAKNVNRFDKKLFTHNETGEAIRIFAGQTERDEALFVARTARELLASDVRASDIAVLFRENFLSRALEEAFIRIGVPYRVLGVRFFDRQEVKDVLAYVRSALNENVHADFARAAGVPTRGIGKQTLEKIASGNEPALSAAARTKVQAFRGTLREIREVLHTRPASEALKAVLQKSGIEHMLTQSTLEEDRERLNNIHELVTHASRFDTLAAPSGLERLLEDAALMGEQDALSERREAVSLMTVHASKGLEFDAVFVTGLEQGLFPSEREESSDAGSARDPEEERRLFYVALTRARKILYLTLAGSRLRYGSRSHTIPSSFLADIDERLITYGEHDALESIIY